MENETTELVILELNETIENKGLELSEAEQIKQSYLPYFVQMGEIKELAKKINFENPTELDEKIARDLRLRTVKIRTGSESVKDERKRVHSLKANIEQASWNLIKTTCLLDEESFLQVEKKREIAEKKRKEDLKNERLELLTEYTNQAQMYPLGEMSEDSFNDLLNGLKLAKQAKELADQKVKEEAEAKAKADAEEKEKLKAENERLAKEQEESKKALEEQQAKADKEKAELEAKAKAEREKADKLAKETKAKADKILADQKAEADKKLKAEKEANEKLAAELKAKKDAEEKAEKDRLAKLKAESDAKIKAEKEAAKASDKDKLKKFVREITRPDDPEGLSESSKLVLKEINQKHIGFKLWCEQVINNM